MVKLEPKSKIPAKVDMRTKAAKYAYGLYQGKTKTQALQDVGVNPSNVTNLERTKSFQTANAFFKDELLKKISLNDIAGELVKNITQDADKGAKNNAIKMALEKIEPNGVTEDDEQNIVVILKQ